MTRADQAIETAADRLESFVRDARRQGGVKAKVGEALAEDPAFLRRLKPSLVKARARGQRVHEAEHAPAPPPAPRPAKPKRGGGGPSPWLVLGAAFAAGYVLAKFVDWRGHAHPRL